MAVGGGGVESLFWVPPVAAGDVTEWVEPGVLGSRGAPPASGTVTSVGLSLPAGVFSISGSPVTTSGTLTGSFVTQSANTVFAGPVAGIAATPSFRALVAADIPSSILPGSFSEFANPTASLGLTAINGVATTAMRSDAAPPLSQAITPTWTGVHTYANNIQFGADNLYTIGTSAGNKPQIVFSNFFRAENGAATNPSISFRNAPGMGFYFVNSTLAWADSGAHRGYIYSGIALTSSGEYAFTNSTGAGTTVDTRFTRGAAATFQLGQANAASPVAYTLQGQGSRAGTDTNVGGASVTVRAGAGTGTGAASSLVLQSPMPVASGTGAQTQTTGATVNRGSLVAGPNAALATTATDGFLYIPTCAGTPTGVPTAQTGAVALVWDTTNKKLYVYDGAWLGGTTPGTFV